MSIARVVGIAAALGGLMSTGCWGKDSSGTPGEMGYGYFWYACVDDGDAVCNTTEAVDSQSVRPDLGIDGQVPAALAVDARFGLHYEGGVPTGDEGHVLPVEVVPARPDVVNTIGGFSFTRTATVAFLARSAQGIVVDFVHVQSAEVAALDFWHNEQRVTSVALEHPGSETVVAVVAVDEADVSLAGAVSYSWSSSDEDVLRLDVVGNTEPPPAGMVIGDDEIRIVGMAEGTATLLVEHGSHSRDITVSVGPEVTQ